jgi:hypothetical protein
VGVRIQEIFVHQILTRVGMGDKLLVEVWDVSGDRKFIHY